MTIAMLIGSFVVGAVIGAFRIIVLAEKRALHDYEINNVAYPKRRKHKHWRDRIWT